MLSKLLDFSPLSEANQITLKGNVREHLEAKPGDLIGFFLVNDEVIVKKVKITEI